MAVHEGVGASVIALHPRVAEAQIQAGVERALSDDLSRCHVPLPARLQLKVQFKEHKDAYRAAHYPGVTKLDDYSIGFETKEYFEVLRLLMFV